MGNFRPWPEAKAYTVGMLRLRSPLLLVVAAFLAASCSDLERPLDVRGTPAIAEDGSLTVSLPGTVLNRYTSLAADAAAGTTTLVLTSAGELDAPAPLGTFGAGDLLLVIQMQGATIDGTNSAAFGAVASLGGAGNYETVVVGAVNGNTVTINAGCGGLRNTYLTAGRTQVVRMPQLANLTVIGFGSIVPIPWNGSVGGVVALHVQGEARVDGSIDASSTGFRGGVVDLTSAAAGTDSTTYRSTDSDDGGEKGEGIAGFGVTYDAIGGRYGRGAPANGGGGGTAHNGGGGGGANGANGNTWTGQGVMDPAAVGATAWALDPGYGAAGNQLTNSSGGGRGGYTYSANDADALTIAPGNAAWGGNNRRERGGLGGRPLDSDPAARLFIGGGGGAGDSNNGTGGAGGTGGGLVFLIADQLIGSGTVMANGDAGVPTTPAYNDGPGGGGGGGTIVVEANGISGPVFRANGGVGGSQPIVGNEAEGPGGGGSGGFIAISTGAPSRTAVGGANGTSISAAVTEFPSNGATGGAAGRIDGIVAPSSIPSCRPLDLSVTKDNGSDRVSRGGATRWTIVVTNDGDPAGVRDVRVQDPLPPSVTSASWTCTATPGSNCDQASGTGSIDTTVDLAFQGSATFEIEAQIAGDAPDSLVNTATVSAPPGFADADPANDSATDTDLVTADYGVEGSGCGCALDGAARAGWASWIALLALPCLALLVRRKRHIARAAACVAVAVTCFGAGTPARAGEDVDLQQFKPAPGAFDVLAVESPRVPGHFDWSAIFGAHYANRPMRLVDRANGDEVASVIGHQSAFDVGAALALRERFEIGVALPVTMNQSSGAASAVDPRVDGKLAGSGIGDLRILPKALLLNRDRWAIGAGMPISLPTASAGGFLGHAGFTARPRLLADVVIPGGITLGGNAGLALRTPERFVNFRQGTAIELGASALRPFEVRGRSFAAVATLAGESGVGGAGVEERPLELLAGVRWNARQATVTVGAGPGLTRGAGTPDYRLFLIVSRTPPHTAGPPPLTPENVRIDRSTLKLDVIEPVYFGTANDLIEPRSFPILEQVAAFLRENPWIRKMRIEGHTDNQGGEMYNLDLSQLRAISIARFLVQNGVDPDVLEAKGYGLSKPVDTNDTAEGRAKNRRVDFVILEIVEATAPDWAKAAMTPIPPPVPEPATPPPPTPPTP